MTFCFSWQDLKDFVRKETKVETAFCQAHRDKVGEGLGMCFHVIQKMHFKTSYPL